MNFEYFQRLINQADYDEIKVIGRDIEKDEKQYHIMGMTLKDKKVSLHVLETPSYLCRNNEEEEVAPWIRAERIHRESMKESMEEDREQSPFLHIREIKNGEKNVEIAGAQSGPLMQNDTMEVGLLFHKMSEAGWKILVDSPFYNISWEYLAVTNIELSGEFDTLLELPEWNENTELVYDTAPVRYPVEMPVHLECGKTFDIEFELENGEKATCYINKVGLHDVWAGQEKRFADPVYRERVLAAMSEAEFEKMKEDFNKILEEHCPKGKCFMALEYECSEENIGLHFYDKEYLNSVPKPSSGSCSSLIMRSKPEEERGIHGFKLRGEMIQKPLDKDVTTLEAELFAYYTMVEKKTCKLADLVYIPKPEEPVHILTEEEKEALVAKYNLMKPESK